VGSQHRRNRNRHKTTFGARSLAEEKKSALLYRLSFCAIVLTAVLGLVQYVVVKQRDSVSSAISNGDTVFRNSLDEDVLKLNDFKAKQPAEMAAAKAARENSAVSYSGLIYEATQEFEETKAFIMVSMENIDRLLDAFPVGIDDLRKQNQDFRAALQKKVEQESVPATSSANDRSRYQDIKLHTMEIEEIELSDICVGDVAMKRARVWKRYLHTAAIVLNVILICLIAATAVVGVWSLKLKNELSSSHKN
jgi:hypothetical protein